MSGLTDQAGGGVDPRLQAQQAWQESMERRLASLRSPIRAAQPEVLADRCGGVYRAGGIALKYWGAEVRISWPALEATTHPEGLPCPTFDQAMLLYYLHTADGTPLADRWIGFRELPDGAFYNQAFQGYTGDRLAHCFGDLPPDLHSAAQALGGLRLPALGDYAYAFQPLPRIRLAAVLWPGDEDFPTQAAVLFDAAASHYMTTDGLALLGSGLARRLERSRGEAASAGSGG